MDWLGLLGNGVSAAANFVGGLLGNKQQEQGQEKEIAAQKEFATNGLRWRVEDAKAAGISPVAALGFSGPSYSPVGLGSNDTASAFSAAGQDIGRAIQSTRTDAEKVDAYTRQIQALNVEHGSLENEVLRSQLRRMNQVSMPSFPTASGSGDLNIGGLPFATGYDLSGRPGRTSTASAVQNQYGDRAEDLYGIPRGIWDAVNNALKYVPVLSDLNAGDIRRNQTLEDAYRRRRVNSDGSYDLPRSRF